MQYGLLVSTFHQVCGIANYAHTLLAALQQQPDWHWDIFTLEPSVIRGLSREEAMSYFAPLLEQARRVSVVHIQHEFSFFQGDFSRADSLRLFAQLVRQLQAAGKRVVVTFHSPVPFQGKPLAVQSRWVWRHQVAPLFRANCNTVGLLHNHFSLKAYLQSGFHLDGLAHLPHFYETVMDPYPVKPELVAKTRSQLQADQQSTVMGIIGFVNRAKGHFFLLDALKHLPDSVKLLVIGGAPPGGSQKILRRLHEAVAKQGLGHRVYITGLYQETDYPSYAACVDVFVAPYSRKFRSSSGALYLAMQSGKPVIASDCPSFVEVNQEVEALAMFPSQNREAFLTQFRRVTQQPSQREQLLVNMRQFMANHAVETVLPQQLQLYSSASTTPLQAATTAAHSA